MDKVQIALEYVRKYHFWLLCMLAVVAGLIGWMKASKTLSDEYKTGKANIEGKFNGLQQIQMNQFPPNDKWKQAITELTDQERKLVGTAWQTVYDEQQKVLKWPDVLGDRFLRWIRNNKPDEEIPSNERQRYRDEVVNVEFPMLVKRVDAKLEVEDQSEDARRGAPPTEEQPKHVYMVEWDSESQTKVQSRLKMDSKSVPSSQLVRLRQEDLWVYQALLDIIRKTNETAKYTSHVKRIIGLSIGAEAAGSFQEGMKPGHIERLQDGSGTEGSGAPATTSPASPGEGAAPDEGRYVDAEGNPLPSGAAQQEQFKRLPVYLELVMNQREITNFLTHCANSPLPVEVRQLRINPEAQSQSSNNRPAAQRGRGDAEPSPTASDVLDATVEIHGIISIYNAPDPAKLGQPSGAMTAGA